jgi:hypothetical protein
MSFRRRARVDQNQAEIVRGLRATGCTVVSLATLGRGAPDVLCGYRGTTYLLEIKRPDLRDHAPDNLRETVRLREQAEWRAKWRGGPVHVVYSVDEALAAVGALGSSEAFANSVVEARRTVRRAASPAAGS